MLVVFCGLPSCGKSTLTAKIAENCSSQYFLEPEEDFWPSWIKEDNLDQFSALNWFRSARVPEYKKAALISEKELVFVDSFYDVLIKYYISDPSFSWLISKENAYYEVVKRTAELDAELLVAPDLLVFIKVSEDDWSTLQKKRNRVYDETVNLIENYQMQDSIYNAARNYCKDTGTNFLEVEQKIDGYEEIVEEITKCLKSLQYI